MQTHVLSLHRFIRLFGVLFLCVIRSVFADVAVCKNIGVNLAGISYYGSEAPFSDLMKVSKGWERPWGTAGQDVPLAMNEQGYPLRIEPSRSLVNIVHDDRWSRPINEDVFDLFWDGQGVLIPHKGAAKIISAGRNQVTFKVIQSGRLWIDLKATHESDPVRNVRLVPHAFGREENIPIFRSRFVNNLDNMRLLRFMQWGNTNNSKLKEWTDRRMPDYGSQATGGKGVAYEYMIELANQMESDLWVNVPHEASDDYVRKMAGLFRDKVNSRQTVYVEYTNEFWNSMFSQFKYFHDAGKRTNREVYQVYVDRALEVFDIWGKEFGNSPRIRFVLAGQFVNPWLTEKILSYRNVSKKIHGFAVGYYIGHDIGSSRNNKWLLSASPQDVITRLRDESIPDARKLLKAQSAITKKFAVELMAYEAGQHLVASGVDGSGQPLIENKKITDLLVGANRHPGMAQIYQTMLRDWEEVGGGKVVFFASTAEPSKWGSWGLRENEAQSVNDAPKLGGIYKFCHWVLK